MNLPNKLSLSRIILIPFFMVFYLAPIPYGKIVATGIFIIASITDMLDGKIARKYNLVTNLGKLLDPIADKLLVISGLLLVVVDGTIPHPYGIIISVIIIGRELLISALRQIAASQNIVMAADKYGKLKTITQVIALPLLFITSYLVIDLGLASTPVKVVQIFAWVMIGIATMLTIISGINYMIKNRNVLKG